MRPSSSRSSSRSSGHRRIADFLAEEHESGDESYGGGMLPVFLADRGDLVEVMLEVDEDSMLVRSVTPTTTAAFSSAPPSLSRSSSTASRIRRKLACLMSPSPADQDREERARLARTRSGAQRALKGLRFISRAAEQWCRVEERFAVLAHDGLLARDDFGECIGMAVESREFAVGVFDALARRRRQRLERISKEELYDFWLQISDHSFDTRLQIFFDMVDTNADGRITREEVQELIVLSASANKLSKLKEQAAEYAALIMEELDPQNLGYIELWQLGELLLQRDSYMSYSRALSTTSGLSQNLGGAGGGERRGGPSSSSGPSWRLLASARKRLTDSIIYFNWRRAWVLAAWACAMVGLFTWKFVQYRSWLAAFEVMGYCLPAAKGAAETLKLNMALVLLPVCRNTLTWLRSTRARRLLPLDDNITFHKTIAAAIVVGVAVHAGTHLGCDFPRLAGAPAAESESLLGWGDAPYTYGSLVGGVEGVTGMAMVGLMCVAFALASGSVRSRLPAALERLRGFNAFWYSHHLLALVYVLLLVHGYFMFLVHRWYHKTTWMYIAVPLLLYLGERTLRTFRSKAYSVKILKVSLLPGSVLSLIMSKPHGFRCRSGQYIFLQCPAISTFEWHPFSLTSAPGDDHLSVHIRTTGDWTQELKHIFTEHYLTSVITLRGKLNDLVLEEQKQKILPRLLVDGPYGAPAQDYRNYDVLLLVGLGIGATPFISILKDLLYNIRTAEELMDSATETSRSDESMNSFISLSASSTISKRRSSHRTRNAHFYWVTREAGSFEWFKGVMDEVAEMDKKSVIEMHNYLTSVYEERDARTTLLTMVQALNHAKHGVDIVSGTRVRTHFARPNWNEVFARIASKHQGATVGVFYCGTPVLAKELKRLCHELSHKTSTRFHFHKEYF